MQKVWFALYCVALSCGGAFASEPSTELAASKMHYDTVEIIKRDTDELRSYLKGLCFIMGRDKSPEIMPSQVFYTLCESPKMNFATGLTFMSASEYLKLIIFAEGYTLFDTLFLQQYANTNDLKQCWHSIARHMKKKLNDGYSDMVGLDAFYRRDE